MYKARSRDAVRELASSAYTGAHLAPLPALKFRSFLDAALCRSHMR